MDERAQHVPADDANRPKDQRHNGQATEHMSSSPGLETICSSRRVLPQTEQLAGHHQ